MNRADLHCHSCFSDGSDTPEELLNIAKEKGLKGLSITDHDTFDAYSDKTFEHAKTLGIELLTGIELSTAFEKQTVHILGYGFDPKSDALKQFTKQIQERRSARNLEILKKLREKHIHITPEELHQKGKVVGRPHIASLLLEKGYVSTFQEAFQKYLEEGASCYVLGFKCTPMDAIEAVHQAGGKAVIAHPHFIKRGRVLKKLLALPFDGIECYYSVLPRARAAAWEMIAEEKGWIMTGGSDYHGKVKPHIELGASTVDIETFQKLCLG
jgi:predicted metal-dependent phosphoesterase TrpH